MTNSSKKQNTAAEKTKAIKGEPKIAQISSKYGVYPTQISKWRKQALDLMQQGFANNAKAKNLESNNSELVYKLYKQIGKLFTECE